MLCIRSPGLTFLVVACLYSLINISPVHPPPAPANHQSSLFLQVQLFQIPHVCDIIQYLSLSVLTYLSQHNALKLHPCFFLEMTGFSSFLGLNDFSLHVYTVTSLAIHPLTCTQVASVPWLLRIMPLSSFHFLWIYS